MSGVIRHGHGNEFRAYGQRPPAYEPALGAQALGRLANPFGCGSFGVT